MTMNLESASPFGSSSALVRKTSFTFATQAFHSKREDTISVPHARNSVCCSPAQNAKIMTNTLYHDNDDFSSLIIQSQSTKPHPGTSTSACKKRAPLEWKQHRQYHVSPQNLREGSLHGVFSRSSQRWKYFLGSLGQIFQLYSATKIA